MPVVPDMIGMVVKDLKVSLDFYRLLGLAIPEGLRKRRPHVEININGYRIAWDSEELIKSIDPKAHFSGRGRMSLAFLCDSPSEVNSTYARLIAAGYEGTKEPWDAFWGQRYALVKDPDGMHVDIFASLDGAS